VDARIPFANQNRVFLGFYRQRTKRRIGQAKKVVGRMYINGQGVEQSLVKAKMWLTHALTDHYRQCAPTLRGWYQKLGSI